MAKLPRTPDREYLRRLPPSLISLTTGTLLHRIYRRGGDYPTQWSDFRHFGPTIARFDHQERDSTGRAHVQTRGILYLALDVSTALAEAFQKRRTVNRTHLQPWIVSFKLLNGLSLLDLTGTFCVRAGGSMKLVSGPPVFAQNWSRAFYECYEGIHGLYYPSSLTNRPVIALYERALSVNPFPDTPALHRELSSSLLIDPLREACQEIGYEFF